MEAHTLLLKINDKKASIFETAFPRCAIDLSAIHASSLSPRCLSPSPFLIQISSIAGGAWQSEIQTANPILSQKNTDKKMPSCFKGTFIRTLLLLIFFPRLSSNVCTQQTVILHLNVCSEKQLRSGARAWFCFNWQLMNPDISWSKHLAKGKL